MEENKIGIDKIYLYQFAWSGNIDFSMFDDEIIKKTSKRVKIIDNNMVEELSFNISKTDKGIIITSANIKLDVTKVHGNNIYPLSYEEYDSYIKACLEYIELKYDVIFDYDKLKVGYIEINNNIMLNHQYSAYIRVNKLISSLMSNYLKVSKDCDHNNNANNQTIYRKNDSLEFCIYNKSDQNLKSLQNSSGAGNNTDILRMELKLLKSKKVADFFGSNTWSDLNDEILFASFESFVQKEIVDKFTKWQISVEKDLIKKILSYRDDKTNKFTKNWHYLLMFEIRNKSEKNKIPYILDYQQVIYALDKALNGNHNLSRYKSYFIRNIVEDDVYAQDDLAKANEIIDKIIQNFNSI